MRLFTKRLNIKCERRKYATFRERSPHTDDLGEETVALGVSETDLGTKAGEESDQRLGNGKRLSVGGRHSPGDSNLLALNTFETTVERSDVEEIGHRLSGVVLIALEVDEDGALGENTLLN